MLKKFIKYNFLLLSLCVSPCVLAQKSITFVDSILPNKFVENVHVIINTPNSVGGLVSGTDGVVKLPKGLQYDSLTVTHVGYKPKTLYTLGDSQITVIKLHIATYVLPSVELFSESANEIIDKAKK